MASSILVTGGTGTLGGHVVPLLRAAGRDVRILSRHDREPAEGIKYVAADLVKGDEIELALEGVETVLHLAGGAKGDDLVAQNLVRAAARAGVKHIVYVSVIGADTVPLPWPGAPAPPAGDLHPPARGPASARCLRPGPDKLYGHIKPKKNRTKFLQFCRYLRSLYPSKIRIAIVLDNFSPHLTTKKDTRVGDWAAANNVEFAYTPTNSSWLNRIEAQFTALRYFALDGTDHASHKEQGSMIRRYIICGTSTPPTNAYSTWWTGRTWPDAEKSCW